MVGRVPDPPDGCWANVDIGAGANVPTREVEEPPAEDTPVLTADPHGVIVVVAHEDVSKFLIRPHSLVSILRPHRAFTATQSARYVQRYAEFLGIQFEGSLSLFDWFSESFTAIR
jgi:hypothetical protein